MIDAYQINESVVGKLKERGLVTCDDYIQKALNEATYYGKNDQLKECEAIVQKMIDEAHFSKVYSEEFANLTLDLSQKIKDIFNFWDVSINSSLFWSCILMSGGVSSLFAPGGCTISASMIIKYVQIAGGAFGSSGGSTMGIEFDKNHKGIVFKPGAFYALRMFLGMDLFMDYGDLSLTAEEIMAVIMHEIGHNFYVGPINEFGILAIQLLTTGDIIRILMGEISFAGMTAGGIIIDSYISDDIKKGIIRITNFGKMIFDPIFNFLRVAGSIKTLILLYKIFTGSVIFLISGVRFAQSIVINTLKYDDEKYADAFAAAYGYAEPLSTSLFKISKVRFRKIPTPVNKSLTAFCQVAQMPFAILFFLTDCHPNNLARLDNNIKYLENSASSISNKVVQKQYLEDIKKLKQMREDIRKNAYPLTGISTSIQARIADFTNISDVRNLISRLNPKKNNYNNLDNPV